MTITESVKKKATELANKAVAKAESVKTQKQAAGSDKISQLEHQIEILKETGGFEGTVSRLELQIAQLKNKIRNQKK